MIYNFKVVVSLFFYKYYFPMKLKIKYILFFIILSNIALAQKSRWEDHFSYLNIKELHHADNKIYALTENALFTYELTYKELNKISKANLLSDVKPNSMTYVDSLEYLVVGYVSGGLDILTPQETLRFIEIPLNEYQGDKKINHLDSQGKWVSISASYGVSLFDLEKKEFAETAFFRHSGDYLGVNESIIHNNKVFAASDKGIYSYEINDLFPNFQLWEKANILPEHSFRNIEKFGDRLFASSGGSMFVYENGNWKSFIVLSNILDIKSTENFMSVTTSGGLVIYDKDLNQVENKSFNLKQQTALVSNNFAFLGTKENGMINLSTNEEIYPDGPFSNNSYGIAAKEGHVWVSPGGVISYNSPTKNEEGFSHFNGKSWTHISSEKLNNAKDIINIAINPLDINTVFASTWYGQNGIFEVTKDKLIKEYNDKNSPIKANPLAGYERLLRFGGACFDNKGNLYFTHAFLENSYSGLYKKTPEGKWDFISFKNQHVGKPGIKAPIADDDGYIWVPSPRGDGVLITDMKNTYQLLKGESIGDLPSNNVYAIAIDLKGTAWIGTQTGLRIKNNPINEIKSGNLKTFPIVIIQDGIPEALLTDTSISDIEVDGSNRKWIATNGTGAFYLSEYGKETILRFTQNNSPLPSNNIYDIAIDKKSGVVYFATEAGVVSYRGDAVETGDSFGEVVAFPNPVRPNYHGKITIKGLPSNADVRITDVNGNLMFKTKSAGGIAEWDGTNLQGQKVASGIYLALMINSEGTETQTTKIAIIR